MLARDSRLIATVMLRKCKEVFEEVKSLGPQNLAFLAGDMFQAIPPANTVLLKSGQERNQMEWEKIFFVAGFSNYKITPAFGDRSLIELYP
ncbi:hypothetical protein FNV43_RR13737 [Rhamnella rubrinervis]|uniref:O-methyltransferase domain-containing protein n=1 Tax=Rhamnella rubrinervis TaxID=2594499 RepID=A0A8K0H1J5_9ROSA|nr:hypothetical protein FNV43_RR13737 [Rhamnella rubrinervis]